MSFRIIAIITATVALALGCGYILVGDLVVGRWQIQLTDGVLLLGKRIGALYLGLSVMFFLARSAPVSVTRTALSTGTAVALSVLVLLGLYELAAGHVGPGILVSVAIEFALAIAYIRILYTERKAAVIG